MTHRFNALRVDDYIITGQLTVDQVDINNGLITFTGTTGNNQILMPDNLADSFSIQEGVNKYITFVTTNSSESVDVVQSMRVDDIDTLTATTMLVGKATATKVEIADTGILTEVQGSLTVQEDLVVNGTTTTINTANVNVADAYIYSNNGYTTAVARTGGAVVNYLPTATTDTVAVGGFTAGVVATSNPTVATTGASTFSVSDIVQISGANNTTNNGIFEVLSHATNVLTIRGVGLTNAIEDFSQTDFITDATATGTITKITVAVMRVGADGIWEIASAGSTTTGITYNDIVDVVAAVNTAITGTGALDSGSITSNFGNINNGTSSVTTGQLTVDQVDINGGIITMTGATGNNQILLPDNLADAFSFQEGANKYMTFVTTNSSESINVSVDLLPTTTNTYDLGSGGAAFQNAYFGGIVETDSLDARTATTLLLGSGTATKVELADTGITTEIQGPLTSSETSNLIGAVTYGTGGTSYVFPTTRGTNNQILKTDASGNVTWQAESGGSTTLQDAYNNSSTPEITTDATRVAITLRRGSGADTDNILEIMSGANVVNCSIDGNGLITVGDGATDYQMPTARGTNNQVLTLNGSGIASWQDAQGTSSYVRHIGSGDFENPTTGNWSINALAPAISDPANSALTVRAFDASTEEGIGWTDTIPTGYSNITLRFVTRAASTPGGNVGVALTLHYRRIPDGAAMPSWTQYDLTDLAYTNANGTQWLHDTETIAFSTFSPALVADAVYQFELTRNAADGGDTMTTDMYMLSVTVTYT